MAKKAVQSKLKDVLVLHSNMSKLYATTSSEKATKYQGGNKKIASSVTADIKGQNVEVARYGVAINEYGQYEVFVRIHGGKELKAIIDN